VNDPANDHRMHTVAVDGGELAVAEPQLRSSVVPDVVPQDSAELFGRPAGDDVLAGYDGPARVARAVRSVAPEEPA
jgi:hypothetical protein